jgi:hypothetical protein
MRRVLVLLVLGAFLVLPAASAPASIFGPPSLKKMTKTPLIKPKTKPGESFTGKQGGGCFLKR